MTATEAPQVGIQLDQDHAPETNGRMAVCRRCGAHTDGPAAVHHTPDLRELPRSASWLVAEAQRRRIKRAQETSRG